VAGGVRITTAEEKVTKKWTGRKLAEDLARTMQSEDKMVWVNLPLGAMIHNPQVADVLVVNKSFFSTIVRIYEVKVTRSDLFNDINRAKYLGYKQSAHYVFFAVPQGLVSPLEIPEDGTGLIVRSDKGWHVVKAARRTGYELDIELLKKLLMRGYEDYWQKYRDRKYRKEDVKRYTTLRQAFYDYGISVARDLARAQEFVETADKLKREIGQLMGKDYDKFEEAAFELQKDVEKLIHQRRGNRLAIQLAELSMRLFDGELFWGDPAKALERILEQARREFPNG
jgi:hypothetical protein